jgi:hypothetical protein
MSRKLQRRKHATLGRKVGGGLFEEGIPDSVRFTASDNGDPISGIHTAGLSIVMIVLLLFLSCESRCSHGLADP